MIGMFDYLSPPIFILKQTIFNSLDEILQPIKIDLIDEIFLCPAQQTISNLLNEPWQPTKLDLNGLKLVFLVRYCQNQAIEYLASEYSDLVSSKVL